MQAEALYNKYRPKTFNQIRGQQVVVSIIENMLKKGNIPHVMLFVGPAGTGKTTTCRILAKEINKDDKVPDIVEFDGARYNGVKDMREIMEQANKNSVVSKYKIIIIDEFHMISEEGQNALLKTFEECPKGCIFMLCTTDPQDILDTIVSRVQQFKLNRIPIKDIYDELKRICDSENAEGSHIKYSEEALNYLARISGGGLRLAISELETCIALNEELTIPNIINALGNNSPDYCTNLLFGLYSMMYSPEKNADGYYTKQCINLIESINQTGKDIKQFVDQFYNFVLDVAKYKLLKSFANTQLPETEQLKADMEKYEQIKIKNILNKLQLFKSTLRRDSGDVLHLFEGFIYLAAKDV